MSGIVGVFNLTGEFVLDEQLRQMTRSLSKCAPDEQNIWVSKNIAFGHSLLRTTSAPITSSQPCSLGQELWLTADARIDNRNDLIRALNLDSQILQSISDSELILHAYKCFGEDCVHHLIGDFTFAIWDNSRRQLFCARDHVGVRQFYYSYKPDVFVFSNSLDCLRLHPSVSSNLNEVAIGDFLLFGLNQDPSTTTFTEIQCLPAAHSLTVSASGIRLQKYWSLTVGTVRYKNEADYVERFSELLNEAVSARLTEGSVGISLSGGLDSAGVAALASTNRDSRPDKLKLHAVCVVYDQVFEDQERYYAGLVSNYLKTPIEFLEGNEVNKGSSTRSLGMAPEPFNVDPIYIVSDELLSRIAAQSRVALTGWDGDAFIDETPRYLFSWLLKNGRLLQLASNCLQYIINEHRPPPLGFRTAWRQWRQPDWNDYPFPTWLNEEFARKLDLVDRWRSINAKTLCPHPVRPRAFKTLMSPSWSALLNGFDSAVTQLPLEVRHPLIDLRVLEYLLALSVIPWLLNKKILRRTLEGRLPKEVLLRKKSPLVGDPGLQLRYSTKLIDIDEFKPVATLYNYINREAIPSVSKETDRNQLWMNVRPFSLNQWLKKQILMESPK